MMTHKRNGSMKAAEMKPITVYWYEKRRAAGSLNGTARSEVARPGYLDVGNTSVAL